MHLFFTKAKIVKILWLLIISNLMYGCVSNPVFLVATNNLSKLQELEPSKVNELTSGGGYTALWLASQRGKTEFVKVLLEKGANPNIVGSTGTSPLLEASYQGNEDIIKLLLDAGADPNYRNQVGATPLIFVTSMNKTSTDIVKELLDKGAYIDVVAREEDKWFSPLKNAVDNRMYDTVELLLERGADVSIPKEHPPLAVASQEGDKKLINKLISYGADINVGSSFNGYTPLHYAMSHHYWKIAEYLIANGADPRRKNNAEENALHVGAYYGMPSTLISILLNNSIDINEKDNTRSSALLFAALSNKSHTALALIEKGADVLLQNDHGNTALHFAVSNTNYSLTQKLVDNGANVTVRNNNGQTPVSLAHANSIILSILKNGPQKLKIEEPPYKNNQPNLSPQPALIGTGSGFFINKSGQILTNYHVVEKCSSLKVESALQTFEADLLAFDSRNDIAVLQSSMANTTPISINSQRNIALGEMVTVLGFPLTSLLGNTLKLTTGNINSHTGIGGDSSLYQISAPIQAGNSGGPVFDESGLLAGLAVATLSLPVDRRSGSIPQNVNYAIKSTAVIEFLEANNVTFSTIEIRKRKSPKEIASEYENSVLMVQCFR